METNNNVNNLCKQSQHVAFYSFALKITVDCSVLVVIAHIIFYFFIFMIALSSAVG